MRFNIPPLRPLLFIALFGWLLASGLIGAQPAGSATGTIQGRVYNPGTREYVRNAEVRLEGTDQITYTENDGAFQFIAVAGGEATIVVTYTGYNTVKETFTVSAGQTAVREINLTSTADAPKIREGVVRLEAFTVSSEREGNAKAIMDQRRSMDITTSVSSDIFGDVTDGNVGEFLKYLPGVDVDYVESEARGPRLGGMEAQYVGVSFDGIRTASADANRGGGDASRATSFEGFSITSIESIEISRTRSAESDADSPAGTINMKTRRAFDRKGRRFGYNFSGNINTEEFTIHRTWGPNEHMNYKWKPNLSLEYSESFFNQRLGILLSMSRANSYTEQYSFDNGFNRNPTAADPRQMVATDINFKDGPKFVLKDALMLTADFRATRRLVLSFNAIYTYTEGDFWNRQFNFVAANDNANVNNGRSRVGGDGLLTLIGTRAASGSVNNVARIDNASGTSNKLTYTRTFAPKFEYKLDAWTFDGALAYSKSVNNYDALERGFSESETLNVPSSWIATRPSLKSWEWTIRQTSGADWYNMANWTGGTRVENSGREWATEIWSGQLNAPLGAAVFSQVPDRDQNRRQVERGEPGQCQQRRLEHLALCRAWRRCVHRLQCEHGRARLHHQRQLEQPGFCRPASLRYRHHQRPDRVQHQRRARHASPRGPQSHRGLVPLKSGAVRPRGHGGQLLQFLCQEQTRLRADSDGGLWPGRRAGNLAGASARWCPLGKDRERRHRMGSAVEGGSRGQGFPDQHLRPGHKRRGVAVPVPEQAAGGPAIGVR
jgi:hypothetical protein